MGKIKASGILKAMAKVRGGVAVSHNKNTADMPAVRIPTPQRVVLPMQQHIGAPCTPTVKVGDQCYVGQVIGDSEAFVSAPIHASISGKVVAVAPTKLANGRVAPAVTIESDGEMTLWEGITPPVINNREDFLKAVRASGLVGLGGAGFPTHVKLGFSPDKNIDTLVVNAAECEPYITVDYRECLDNSENIIGGIHLLVKYLGFKRVVIAVEDNKPEAIKILADIAQKDEEVGATIELMTLKSKYPQGAEKMMVQSATGRKVPPGKLPADVGCVVMNVGSVAFVSRYVKTGRPLVSRSMTVDGSGIAEPKNIRVPVGISVREVIDFCGGFKGTPYKIIAGGPMMGAALIDTDVPVLKSNNAVLAFSEDGMKKKRERDCIHCGRCASACPMSLAPLFFVEQVKLRNAEELSRLGVNVCMECGSCSYVCPAGLPLVQHMRLAKEIVREEANKK